MVLVGQYSEWLPCCPHFQIFPSFTSAFSPEFLLCGKSIPCSVMTVVSIGFHMTESLMSLMQTVTSGGCFAFIYLFTYGKQVTNSIGHFFLFMQSVLLLHCPPTIVSAGDFKLSLAFIETWKTEHLFLLLSHFIACASSFWAFRAFSKGGSALVWAVWCGCGRWENEPSRRGAVCFHFVCGGTLAQQRQHEWHWARLMGTLCLQDELTLVKCWYLSLPAL